MHASSPYTLLAKRRLPNDTAPHSPTTGLTNFVVESDKAHRATREKLIEELVESRHQPLSLFEDLLCRFWYDLNSIKQLIETANAKDVRHPHHGPR